MGKLGSGEDSDRFDDWSELASIGRMLPSTTRSCAEERGKQQASKRADLHAGEQDRSPAPEGVTPTNRREL